MGWLISLLISWAALIGAIVLAAAKLLGRYKRGRILTPFRTLFGGVALAVFICLLPIFWYSLDKETGQLWKTVLFSLHNTFQIFTVDADKDIILKGITCSGRRLAAVYSAYLSAAFVAAPILTFGFLFSLFKNAASYGRYLLRYFGDVYVFSELNERALCLAADVRREKKRAVIVFTDVFERDEESGYEKMDQARELRAICFKKDVTAVNFKRHSPRGGILFFTIGENEAENIAQSLRLIDQYRDRENTRLFVFSSRVESELLMTRADKGKIKVRRVNETRFLVNRLLYERGTELFESARPMPDGDKQIAAVLVGLGGHGTEMLKALCWYCQMDGYHLTVDAFDKDEMAGDRFAALAPELVSEKYNGVRIPGEAEYTVRIHSHFDVTTASFAREIGKLTDTTYVFISLGSDELNVRTAVNMRMLFERMKIKPLIRTMVYSTDERVALQGITNYRGQPYDIEFFGDRRSTYSCAMILSSELEKDALARHMKWGKEEEFWQYEYNYNSSVASAIHLKARIACKAAGADKKEEELTEEEKLRIEALEHRRWNAYMRSEGYVYSGSPDKASRNDLGKMHHDLADYASLSDEEKRKDSRVGTG